MCECGGTGVAAALSKPIPAPACRYYGKSALALKKFGALVVFPPETTSNQCAAVFEPHAPCKMEVHHYPPDETRCPIARSYLRRSG